MSVNMIHWDILEVVICFPYTTVRYLMAMVLKDFKQHTGLACSTFNNKRSRFWIEYVWNVNMSFVLN